MESYFDRLLQARLDDHDRNSSSERTAYQFALALRRIERMVDPATGRLTDAELEEVSERAAAAADGTDHSRFTLDEVHLLLILLAKEVEARRQSLAEGGD